MDCTSDDRAEVELSQGVFKVHRKFHAHIIFARRITLCSDDLAEPVPPFALSAGQASGVSWTLTQTQRMFAAPSLQNAFKSLDFVRLCRIFVLGVRRWA